MTLPAPRLPDALIPDQQACHDTIERLQAVREPRIVVVGNPNTGKTTLINALAGTNLKVGNWAGVTVEKILLTHGHDLAGVVEDDGTGGSGALVNGEYKLLIAHVGCLSCLH